MNLLRNCTRTVTAIIILLKRKDWKTWTSIVKASYLWMFQICQFGLLFFFGSTFHRNIKCIPKSNQNRVFFFQLVKRHEGWLDFFSKGGKFEKFKDKKFSSWMFRFSMPTFNHNQTLSSLSVMQIDWIPLDFKHEFICFRMIVVKIGHCAPLG